MSASIESMMAHWKAGRLDKAEAELRSMLADGSAKPEARGILAILLLESRRVSEAFDEATAAIKTPGELGAGYEALGKIHHQRGEYAEAIPHLRRAIELDGRTPEILALLSICHDGTGNHESAQIVVEEGLKKWPGHPLLLNASIGNRLLRRIGQDEFPEDAEEIVQSPEAWIHRGETRQEASDEEGALQAFEEALRIEPESAEARRAIAGLAAQGVSPWKLLLRGAIWLRSRNSWVAGYALAVIFALDRWLPKRALPPPSRGILWILALLVFLSPALSLVLLWCDKRGRKSLLRNERFAAPLAAALLVSGVAAFAAVFAFKWVHGLRISADLVVMSVPLAVWASATGWAKRVLGVVAAICAALTVIIVAMEFVWPGGTLSMRPPPANLFVLAHITFCIGSVLLAEFFNWRRRERALPWEAE